MRKPQWLRINKFRRVKPRTSLAFNLCDTHNAHLASTGYPAKEVFDADASFAKTILGLLDCDALTSALARTHASPEFPIV